MAINSVSLWAPTQAVNPTSKLTTPVTSYEAQQSFAVTLKDAISSVNEKQIQSFADLTKAEKIALGTRETVPAGQYGVESLQNMKLWSAVESKIVYTKDVRQVLTYTETENVDAGIVYKTDALVSDKVSVVASANEDTHTPIIYPVGVIKDSKHVKEAEDFYHFLQSDEAMKVFEKYGFQGAN